MQNLLPSVNFSLDIIQRFDLSSLPDEGALGKAVMHCHILAM